MWQCRAAEKSSRVHMWIRFLVGPFPSRSIAALDGGAASMRSSHMSLDSALGARERRLGCLGIDHVHGRYEGMASSPVAMNLLACQPRV